MVKLFGKPLRVNKSAQDRNTQDVGANLFIGGLDPEVDEKVCAQAAVALRVWYCAGAKRLTGCRAVLRRAAP